jgi:hypothetical protein
MGIARESASWSVERRTVQVMMKRQVMPALGAAGPAELISDSMHAHSAGSTWPTSAGGMPGRLRLYDTSGPCCCSTPCCSSCAQQPPQQPAETLSTMLACVGPACVCVWGGEGPARTREAAGGAARGARRRRSAVRRRRSAVQRVCGRSWRRGLAAERRSARGGAATRHAGRGRSDGRVLAHARSAPAGVGDPPRSSSGGSMRAQAWHATRRPVWRHAAAVQAATTTPQCERGA